MELTRLNESARLDQDLGDGIDWSLEANPHLPWIPENLSHLFHLKSYEKLSSPARTRYNQFFALLVIEQIATFERDILAHIDSQVFSKIKERDKATPELKTALEHFVREEENHVAFFEKLITKSRLALRLDSNFNAFQIPPLQNRFLSFLFSFPNFFVFWIWVVLFVEERTLLIARLMRKNSEIYDPLHMQVQEAHLRDEIRHVQLDEHLLQICWDPAPQWLKKLNLFLLKVFFELTFVGSMSAARLWNVFSAHVPQAAPLTSEVVKELCELPSNKEYMAQFFSRESAPRFWRMLHSRPEMNPIVQYLQDKI